MEQAEGHAWPAWQELARAAGLGGLAAELQAAAEELEAALAQAREVLAYPLPGETEPALVFQPGWEQAWGALAPAEQGRAGPAAGGPVQRPGAAPALSGDAAPSGAPACFLSVSEAAALVARGDLSPVELVTSCLERIEQVEPAVGAWVQVLRDEALEQARRAEQAVRQGQQGLGPLHGIPFGAKDIFHAAGVPTRAGTRGWQVLPDEDAEAVRRLRQAGAILLGKTTTTEFAFRDPPATRNPWKLAHTPGGSSSGSAAAVAARMVPLALGSQTGGSLSRPAAYCGVVTLKPTYGLVSRRGVLPLAWSLDHVGAFTRTVEDQALVLAVLAGADPHDPATWLAGRAWGARPAAGAAGPRAPGRAGVVGVPDRFFGEQAEPACWQLFQQALRVLEQAGYRVESVKLPSSFEAAQAAHALIMRVEAAAYHLDRLRSRPEMLRGGIRRLAATGAVLPAVAYERAQQLRRLYAREMAELFRHVTLLATPATPGPAPVGLEWTGPFTFNAPFSMAGLPTLTLPMGRVEPGLPVGLQLAARPFGEEELLEAGMAFQAATSWHRECPAL